MPLARPSGPDRGFTLIEVLAALVIVSLGMLGVIQAVSQTASNSVYLRDKTLAHWIAMNRLTEVRLAQAAPAIAKTSDELDYAGRRWRWSLDVQETAVESMRRVDVRVSLAESGDDGSALAMLTGFYGDAIAKPGTVSVNWDPVPNGPPQDGTAGAQPPPGSAGANPPTTGTQPPITAPAPGATP
ncbi:MAG: type II secretion system minor pseudopilin GspI [Steroidobacteraceae bacterium]